jgi:hypothetical protein
MACYSEYCFNELDMPKGVPGPDRARKSNIRRIENDGMKQKELTCFKCGNLAHRVVGVVCGKINRRRGEAWCCVIRYQEEGPLEVSFSPMSSALGHVFSDPKS